MYNNLRFFNGTKSELQLVQDENNIWTGSIYLPEVSAALYETVNLFILEECIHKGDVVINTPISPDGTITKFKFEWDLLAVDESVDVIMYGTRMDKGKAFVVAHKTQELELAPFNNIISQDASYVKTITDNTNICLLYTSDAADE